MTTRRLRPRPRWTHNAGLSALIFAAILMLPLSSRVALAAEITFEEPSARATLGEPIVFETEFTSTTEPLSVELLTHLPQESSTFAQLADVQADGERYTARVTVEGHTVPNTTFGYRFRVTFPDETVEGPRAQATVTDDRFDWRTLEGDLVRLHWYEGDDAFAERALRVGEDAMADVSELLGVTESEPVDFFVYADEAEFYAALGPGTRENVGGQAHSEIRTMFALIRPSEIGSDWIDVVIPHELAHLVFNTAVENIYHFPPRWLNEGVAVYVSEGNNAFYRDLVTRTAGRGEIIPLDGLAGQFPTSQERFLLAYAESVSAVDFFIRTYGQDVLVELIRSYREGVTDDDAFRAATGDDVATFDRAWLAEIGSDTPEAHGPQPGPTGPLPPDWDRAGPVATSSAATSGAIPSPSALPPPSADGASDAAEGGEATPTSDTALRPTPAASLDSVRAGRGTVGGLPVPGAALAGVAAGATLGLIGLLIARRRQRQEPG